jgi:hypothetical protein
MAERLDADALRALEERLDRAAAAAERLLAEAGTAGAGAGGPGAGAGGPGAGAGGPGAGAGAAGAETGTSSLPPRGWQRAAGGGAAGGAAGGGALGGWIDSADAELLFSLLAGLRDRIPADLQQRLAAALHEVLQALRALIDWCLERAERRRAAPTEVQDIPIL